MKIGAYLKNYQKVVFQTFLNALNTSHLSHAYLLIGEQGTPLLESAIFLAKSLVCDHPNPLACEECLTCHRIDDHTFADLIIIDGAKQTIKKDDINLIETQFETSSVESKGKMIYIINHVENMTLEAINALLKFLEEPANNIYAFLTAENESKVLPTIVSRSQTLHFKSIDKQEMKKEAINLGVELKDAELLCNFYNNAELIKQKIDDKDYQNAKKSIDNTLDILSNNKNIAIPKLHSLVFPNVKSKEAARLYLDMLTIVFQDLVNLSIGSNMFLTSYEDNLKTLSKHLKQINNSLLLIMTSRGQIDMNINIGLLLDHIFQNILGDD